MVDTAQTQRKVSKWKRMVKVVLLWVQPKLEHGGESRVQAAIHHRRRQLPGPFFPAELPAVLGLVPWAPHRVEDQRGLSASLAPYKVLWLLRAN